MLKGGCFCGRIRYEAAGTSFNETSCHCSICRRTSGAAFDVTTCSLDDPDALPPADHTRISSKLAWVKLADQLPAYQEGRQEG